MTSIRDAEPTELVKKTADILKGKIKQPDWSLYVKTGTSRERLPENPDWWYIRAASVLRRIYVDGPVGVSRLRSYYGSRKRLGHQPAHFKKSSGKVIRVILQDMEKQGLIKKDKKGRRITAAGQSFLDKIAKDIKNN